MDYAWDMERRIAAEAHADARAAFMRRTYLHLAGAILLFALLETVLLQVVPRETIATMFASQGSWLVVLLVFMGVAWVADYWAQTAASPALQYAGLGLYVLAESVIFLPLLTIAELRAPGVIKSAGVMTLGLFGGLTVTVFLTKHDFSYLRSILTLACFISLGFIGLSMFGVVSLGSFFALAMIVLACGFILYDTSNVLHHYRTDQHVAASLALFASVALLFWYVIQYLMLKNRD